MIVFAAYQLVGPPLIPGPLDPPDCDFGKPPAPLSFGKTSTTPGLENPLEWRQIWGQIVIAENLATPGFGLAWEKPFDWKHRPRASIVISENLPRRSGLSANAGPGTGSEWTPGGGELGGRRDPHV